MSLGSVGILGIIKYTNFKYLHYNIRRIYKKKLLIFNCNRFLCEKKIQFTRRSLNKVLF